MNTIVCIGDSLTYGKSWLNGSDLSLTLNTRLSIRYSGLSVVNLGVNGDTSSGVDSRKTDADRYSPFRVIVWIGINDVSSGVSANTLETNLQSIYTYYKSTKKYEVWAVTITPKDDDGVLANGVRLAVNVWIRNDALNVDRVIDAWTTIRDPNDVNKRLPAYADPNTQNHMNDAGMAAIVSSFPAL